MDVLRRTISDIHAFNGAMTLLIDHDVDLIQAVCSSTMVLDFGSLVTSWPDARGAQRSQGAGGLSRGGGSGMSVVDQPLTVTAAGNKRVVDDLSLRLEPEKITALLGPNGAGKSSLVLALAGVSADRGRWDRDRRAARWRGRRRRRFVRRVLRPCPEGHRVLPGMSVHDNLLAAGFGHTAQRAADAVEDVYGIFPELAERKAQKAGSMSGGQQQMLALGQALVRGRIHPRRRDVARSPPLIVKRLMGVCRLAAEGTGIILLIEQFTQIALQIATECT